MRYSSTLFMALAIIYVKNLVIGVTLLIVAVSQSRAVAAWSWWSCLVAGLFGVIILLLAICYCRLMPRHQRSFDDQYLQESYRLKENQHVHHHHHHHHVYSDPDNEKYTRVKQAESGGGSRSNSGGNNSCRCFSSGRSGSKSGRSSGSSSRSCGSSGGSSGANCGGSSSHGSRSARPVSYAGDRQARSHSSGHHTPIPAPVQYASSSMLDDLEAEFAGISLDGCEALKTRSLPSFLRPRPRPLSSEADLYQLYDKVSCSKRQRPRMRNEHAMLIALSKAQVEPLDDDAEAVIVYDQRTAL